MVVVKDRNRRLYAHAAPVMEMLLDQIVGAESMVVLCDATGTIIHCVGDDDFLSRASKVALQPGINWSEQAKGTNAIGTALIEEMPTLVHADEHFLHAKHFLTCSAAPILDPRGNILGVLDVTGDHRSYHQHTMALVRMSARMIENHWLSDDYRNSMRLHFHSRVEFIGTLMEGILAVSPDGRIVGANRSALELLGLSSAALRLQSLVSLLGTTVGALVDRFRSPLATPMAVHTGSGRSLSLHARFNWPVWSDVTAAAAVAPVPVPCAAGAALAAGSAHQQHAADVAGTAEAERRPGDAAQSPQGGHAGLGDLESGDPQISALIGKVRRVLDRGIPILVLGDTGTGKELLARAIHCDAARALQPFVAVNCASIPGTLIEVELFGCEAGAFTSARRKGSVGKILQASGGTLFLAEIDDMPLPLQARLLRVLQERCVTPLGSTNSLPVDVTIICASHRNLREMIAAKQFREDLYYRLNGLSVKLPPLRERTDLAALVRRILDANEGGRHLRLANDVLEMFEACDWPGHVRQFFNVLRTAVVMAGPDRMITREHLRSRASICRTTCSTKRAATGAPGARAASAVPKPHLQRRPPRQLPRRRRLHRKPRRLYVRWKNWNCTPFERQWTRPAAISRSRRATWASAATPSIDGRHLAAAVFVGVPGFRRHQPQTGSQGLELHRRPWAGFR